MHDETAFEFGQRIYQETKALIKNDPFLYAKARAITYCNNQFDPKIEKENFDQCLNGINAEFYPDEKTKRKDEKNAKK